MTHPDRPDEAIRGWRRLRFEGEAAAAAQGRARALARILSTVPAYDGAMPR